MIDIYIKLMKLSAKIAKKIDNIKVESFKTALLTYYTFYLNHENNTANVNEDSLIINIPDGSSLTVTIKKDGILESIIYEIKYNNVSKCCKYFGYKDGYYIEESTTNCKDILLSDKKTTYKDVECERVFKFFDKNGIETSRNITKKVDGYFFNNESGKTTLCVSNPFKNYIQNVSIYRKENNILKNVNRIYLYPEHEHHTLCENFDSYFFSEDVIKKSIKEIPEYWSFYGIDEAVFKGYLNGEIKRECVIENVKIKKRAMSETYMR